MGVVLDEKVVYQTPSPSVEKANVLWVSRHPPLPSQIQYLENKLGRIRIIQISGVIPNADTVIQLAKKYNASIIVPVLPLSFIARLAEVSKREGFAVLFARMEAIFQGSPEEAKSIQKEAPEKRTITTYADNTCKVHEFRGFEKVIAVEIKTELW